jgi:hypothetical protein
MPFFSYAHLQALLEINMLHTKLVVEIATNYAVDGPGSSPGRFKVFLFSQTDEASSVFYSASYLVDAWEHSWR